MTNGLLCGHDIEKVWPKVEDRIPHHSDKAKARKAIPLATGVLDYFPLALMEVAKCSRQGNEQHNPGTPLHWDRSKSGDDSDALLRHLIDRGKLDEDGILHTAKVAWRALAILQKELEEYKHRGPEPKPAYTETTAKASAKDTICPCAAGIHCKA